MRTRVHSILKKTRFFFTNERPLFQLGPVYVALSPVPYIMLGVLMTFIMLMIVYRAAPLFQMGAGADYGIWGGESKLLFFAILAGAFFVVRVRVHGKPGFVLGTVMYISLPITTYHMIEFVNGMEGFSREPALVFMNVIFIAVVYLLFLIIFGSYRWSGFISIGIFYAFAVACYYIQLFRGTPFVPLDLFATETGMNVAANYVFELTIPLTIATVWTGLMLAMAYQLGRGNLVRARWKITQRVVALLAVLLIASMFYSQSYLQDKHYTISYWDQEASYEKYGNWMAFCLNLRNVFPEKPDAYAANSVSKIVDTTLEDSDIVPNSDNAYNMITGKNDYKATKKQPNIIMIMNESFAELDALGDLKTNIDVMPFFKSLKENTIRGNLQVSTHGGGTACTEYEALTGNSQSFLSAGAVAYSASMRESTPSVVWNLRAQGYQTDAFHPYYSSGWSRDKAYAYMGFESFTALEDLLPQDTINVTTLESLDKIEKTIDPNDGDVYNRGYMSDHYDFKLVEKLYEARDKSRPYFMFNVTIQNHGGYLDPCPNFQEEVKITNMDGDYPQANRYLSLMHASDTAFEELISYFKNVKEPTIVVMFGDHLPSLEKDFYTELCGEASENFDINQTQAFHQTPFVIWANYDIPEKNIGTISTNYLSTLIMETAGLELTDYERYLASMSKSLPVISNLGYVDGQGEAYYTIPENKPVIKTLVNDYKCVAYNNLVDTGHRDWSVFTLNGEALPSTKAFTHKYD